MNTARTQYTTLRYVWRLLQGEAQIATGGFQTTARMEYESQAAFQAGDAPIKVYHKSAQMKCRKQAEFQLRALRKYPNGGGNWGKWRSETAEATRSAPLLVDGTEVFRIYLAIK